jgi:hypothetical protein
LAVVVQALGVLLLLGLVWVARCLWLCRRARFLLLLRWLRASALWALPLAVVRCGSLRLFLSLLGLLVGSFPFGASFAGRFSSLVVYCSVSIGFSRAYMYACACDRVQVSAYVLQGSTLFERFYRLFFGLFSSLIHWVSSLSTFGLFFFSFSWAFFDRVTRFLWAFFLIPSMLLRGGLSSLSPFHFLQIGIRAFFAIRNPYKHTKLTDSE